MRGTVKQNGVDRYFYKYGKTGKQYFFHPYSPTSRYQAFNKAEAQGKAIKASQSKRKIMG